MTSREPNQTTQRTAAPRRGFDLAGRFSRWLDFSRTLPGGCRWSRRSAASHRSNEIET
jgi:hypothetical protein